MKSLLLFNFLGPEMLIIFFAILLLFGGKKIPELMKGIGKGIREFNTARSTIEGELKQGMRKQEMEERKALEDSKRTKELEELRELKALKEQKELAELRKLKGE